MTERFAKAHDIVCPKCRAAIGSYCLVKKLDGHNWRTMPHNERIDAAQIIITEQERKENGH